MKTMFRRLLRTKVMSRAVGWSVARLITTYFRTIRVHMVYEAPELHHALTKECCVYSAWHEDMFLWAYVGAHSGANVLVSQSGDGETIARIIESLGFRTVRGSSTRGAVRALRRLVRAGGCTHVAITPDGPRGPRRSFQPGAVYLASRIGMTLVPMGFAYGRPWRASSWDRLALPRPFSRVVCYGGTPITVPGSCNAAGLARYQQYAGDAMRRATAQAERLLAQLPRETKLRHWGPGKQIPDRVVAAVAQSRKAA
jgi:lysophospholipid acyltransferase (LPLAT)-like uncharacterized protein